MKKIIIAVLGVVVLLVLSYVVINRFSFAPEGNMHTPERTTLTGTYVCLPLRDSTRTDTDCAVGIHSEEGAYYAVDFGFYAESMPQLVEGDKVSAQGIVTPIETLSTDYWQKYPVVGIFSVTSTLTVTKREEENATATPTLANTAWVWQKTILNDGSMLEAKGDMFVLTFAPNSSYVSTTDCNSLSGTYTVESEVLSLAPPSMTKMFCEGSLETEYVASLILSNSYRIEEDTLILNLDRDYGVMEFKAQ